MLKKINMSHQSLIDQAFAQAVHYVRNTPPAENITDEIKLEFYANFKQATEGDVSTTRPGLLWFRERAKWDAWNLKRGISRNRAKLSYIELAKKFQ